MQVATTPTKVYADRFALMETIGEGGMGVIHRARDLQTGALVALKVLQERHGVATERFHQEAALLAELAHPAIVRYVAHGVTAGGEHYLAMEWLDGETLEERLARGPIGVLESARLARRTLEALALAHRRGVIHRDIKPGNLFLPHDDLAQVKLLDFGIARRTHEPRRLTQAGSTLGTPMYMSPEQARGEPTIDGRADLFSLGCVLFECLTGQPPFTGENPIAVLAKICLEEPPDVAARCPGLSPDFARIIDRMLAKDAAARPARTDELAEEFAALCRHLQDQGHGEAAPLSAVPLLAGGEQRILAVVMASRSRQETPGPTPPETLSAVRRALEPFAAQVDSLLDGSMVVTLVGRGAPTDQAGQAVRAAFALREVLPTSAFAVSLGRAVLRATLPIGEVVDEAARLLFGQAPGTVSVDPATAALLEPRFEIAGGPRHHVLHEKGLDEAPRTVLGKELPCLGRDRELATLEALFVEGMSQPAARVALVTAPAGGGKSRVRYELGQRLERRGEAFTCLRGYGDVLRAGAPFALLGPALRVHAGLRAGEPPSGAQARLTAMVRKRVPAARAPLVAAFLGEMCGVHFPDDDLPALAAARADPRQMADQMMAAWLTWLEAECAHRPVLLVLEDVHWGDLPSVQFVDAALRALAERPLLVLACARPEVHEAFPALWENRDVVRLALPPLTSKACQRLARHVLSELGDERAAWLVERADGNPFVLEELLRATAAGTSVGEGVLLPSTVLGMVQARFDALGAEARRVLSAASVFGQAFARAGVAALLRPDEDPSLDAWLEILSAREVVYPRADERSYVFRHALLRDAAYDLLPADDRKHAHLRAGEHLEAAGEREAIVLVQHFELGGAAAKAALWCRYAAAQALDASDLAGTIARAERGLRNGAAGETRGQLRLCEAQARFWRGEYALAEAAAQEAVTLVSGPARLQATGELAAALGQQARWDDVQALLAGVLARAPAAPERHAYVGCALRAADYLLAGGRYEQSEAALARLEDLARALPPKLAARWRELGAKLACHAGDQAAGVAGFEAALQAFAAAGDERSACELLANLGVTLGELGQLESAEEHLRRALVTAERLDLQYVVVGVVMNLALVLTHQGRLDDARTCAVRAQELARAQGDRRFEGAALLCLGLVDVGQGAHEDAQAHARQALAALHDVAPAMPLALAVLARAQLGAGQARAAVQTASEASALLESLGRVEDGEATVRLVHAEALGAVGEQTQARLVLARAKARLEERAASIATPAWRSSFLSRLPDHARTLALAAEHLR